MALGALVAFGAVSELAIAAIVAIPKRSITSVRISNLSQPKQQYAYNGHLSFSYSDRC